MADNWEDRLKNAKLPDAPKGAWETRIRLESIGEKPNPAADGNTLQILNPFGKNFDTGLDIGAGTQNFLAGAGKALADTGKGIAQKFGGYSFDDAGETARRDAALMNTRSGSLGNLTGNDTPKHTAPMIPGAGTMLGAAAIGAGTGFMQPAASAGEMGMNAGIGAAAGPAGNALGRLLAGGVGLGRSVLEPFFAGGQQRIADDILQKFTPDVRRALTNLAADPGQLVPGSMPNAAEAAQLPGIAQLVKQLRQTPGSAGQQAFIDRDTANQAARMAAVRGIAGDESQRAAAVESRESAAKALYGQAFASDAQRRELALQAAQANNSMSGAGVQRVADLPVSPELQALSQRPAFQDASRAAQQLAANEGFNIGDPLTSLQGLHYIKLAIDQQLNGGSPMTALAAHGDRALTGIKSALLDQIEGSSSKGIEGISPLYSNARQTFAVLSQPINQMDVGQALSDKLVPALKEFGGNGNLAASGFAQALRSGDAVAQRALGQPRATMADVLGQPNMDALTGLGQDLARAGNVGNLARAGGSDTIQNSMSQNIINQTLGPLGLPSSLGGNALLQSMLRPAQYAASIGEGKITDKLAQMLLSPQDTATALQRADQPRLGSGMANALINYGAPTAATAAVAAPKMDYEAYLKAWDAAPDFATKKAISDAYRESWPTNLPQQ